ncbi:MAG: RNA polymerase sigma factor RpoE [Methylicorpusculum sp.]|uniref:RNA polymerase sigma factor RpoE n=1 Tax=Methylicorpusculum sp. TaxID=2713644 RepID=UPI0027195C6E|nr:RNA polymerase sigma factor RpoE [Methylicorpusculum sp.]MDO8845553.1 RNA polymerase sigma factor RpoE [Methylicorpusculum sp.]MDO8938952.1 RNA polymerase sigma factor RpoE [Methylicorpusculum sp.]MDP2179310.1 RNA polymerase sigma factor RpoE [Methylicorpusculum sp.]MDP2200504.1 RNA polymerase sigma factor RpoE [Methylicorpusculum sp.]MDP3530092.1 RNA polymerase sigma factor RpoE [Methylicorpusculum sp.]
MKNKTGNSEELDQDLVLRVQQGDKSAYDLLVIKYQHKIIQLVNRYVKDQSEAQDVAQETFIKAYRALGNFRGDSAFYTWLYRIAINTAKNYLVARTRRGTDSELDIDDEEQVHNINELKGLDTPEQMLLNDEIIETIKSAIEKLPEEMRIAITLREFEGMSYEEIAEAMDCPVGTVRSRIFRAREAIDSKLNPLLG